MQCFMNKPELQQALNSIQEYDEDDEDADDMFAFDKPDGGDAGGFTKVGVTIDKTTGEFIGVDQLLSMAEGNKSQVNRESTQSAASNHSRQSNR